jgi:hypothetical protein
MIYCEKNFPFGEFFLSDVMRDIKVNLFNKLAFNNRYR